MHEKGTKTINVSLFSISQNEDRIFFFFIVYKVYNICKLWNDITRIWTFQLIKNGKVDRINNDNTSSRPGHTKHGMYNALFIWWHFIIGPPSVMDFRSVFESHCWEKLYTMYFHNPKEQDFIVNQTIFYSAVKRLN